MTEWVLGAMNWNCRCRSQTKISSVIMLAGTMRQFRVWYDEDLVTCFAYLAAFILDNLFILYVCMCVTMYGWVPTYMSYCLGQVFPLLKLLSGQVYLHATCVSLKPLYKVAVSAHVCKTSLVDHCKINGYYRPNWAILCTKLAPDKNH